jgi:hypothetical protein
MKKVLLGFALSLLSVVSVLAQSKTITGKVTSAEEPEGVPGASVVVKGTTQGTITDLDGAYSITVPDNSATLVFSFVGYLTQEIPVGTGNVVNVTLSADVKTLGEVIVVRLLTRRCKALTKHFKVKCLG